MKYEIQANANDTITPHAIFAVNGPMVARTVTLAEAQFIVRACNSHEQLVAVAKLAKSLTEFIGTNHGGNMDLVDQASTALIRIKTALAAAGAA